MSCKDILIVEDNQDIREGFAFLFEEEGYDVIQAENGFVALDILRHTNKTPDCIILDLMMPVMDGKTFLETLRKDHPNDLCKIPIIVTTAVGSSDAKMPELPCLVEKLSKPLDIVTLLHTVKKHCGEIEIV